MKIEFIPINYHHLPDCEILAKWFNNPEINYLISPNFFQGSSPKVTATQLSKMNTSIPTEKYAYFIVCNDQIIGDINIIDNPNYLLKKDRESSWLGITIGEKSFQGLGVGKKAMVFIEQLAKDLGFKRMELGVFSFNTKAISFYKKLGYQQFGVVPNFTFYNGIWYDDLRFEKYL